MYNKVSDARKHEQTCNVIFFFAGSELNEFACCIIPTDSDYCSIRRPDFTRLWTTQRKQLSERLKGRNGI